MRNNILLNCCDCGGFDCEWMRKCAQHKTMFCRGCDCIDCLDEERDYFDEEEIEDDRDRAQQREIENRIAMEIDERRGES